jgi:hypothetical protein
MELRFDLAWPRTPDQGAFCILASEPRSFLQAQLEPLKLASDVLHCKDFSLHMRIMTTKRQRAEFIETRSREMAESGKYSDFMELSLNCADKASLRQEDC